MGSPSSTRGRGRRLLWLALVPALFASGARAAEVTQGLVTVDAGVTVRDVALGRRVCVLSDAGVVRCGETVARLEDVPLPGPATALAAGAGATCAILADGAIACWDCELPSVSKWSLPWAPQMRWADPSVLPLPKMKSVSVARSMACGVTLDGGVQCWGDLRGKESSPPEREGKWICDFRSPKIATVETLPRVTSVARVALAPEASAFGSPETFPVPPDVTAAWVLGKDGRLRRNGVEKSDLPGVLDVQSGGEVVHRAAVDVHGAAVDGDKSRDWTAEPPNTHTCALLVGGRVACWGDNRFSQAGSTTAVTSFPRPAVQLAVGPDHNCALLTDGSVACWGADPGGLLESTSANACPARCRYARCNAGPKRIWGLGDVSRVRVGPRNPPFSCAVTRAGRLVCWGNGYGVNTVREAHPEAPACEPPLDSFVHNG